MYPRCAIREYSPAFVVDATHPYAREVSRNIKQACESCGKSYLRLLREEGTSLPEHDGAKDGTAAGTDDRIVWVESAKEAGRISGGQGRKDPFDYRKQRSLKHLPDSDYRERVYARVLSLPRWWKNAIAWDWKDSIIISMQGPFSAGSGIWPCSGSSRSVSW